YDNCTTLMIGSKGYEKSICNKGDFKDKIEFFPNWVEDSLESQKMIDVPKLPKGFNVVIAGNMGDAQDLPHIMETARMLKGSNIRFNFIGDGRKREYVENYARENGLMNNIFCLGRYPLEAMPAFFAQADILFMALKDTPIFALTVPSRLQAYMSSGKPVVAMINGEGADTIREADCGWSVSAGDSEQLATLLKHLSTLNKDELTQKGANGKKYSRKYYDFTKCINHLEKIIGSGL
ncbi:glycosyltransferase family 4 protein, partial [uncultured Muribaculum sp.]